MRIVEMVDNTVKTLKPLTSTILSAEVVTCCKTEVAWRPSL